jgi:hypothetical protein
MPSNVARAKPELILRTETIALCQWNKVEPDDSGNPDIRGVFRYGLYLKQEIKASKCFYLADTDACAPETPKLALIPRFVPEAYAILLHIRDQHPAYNGIMQPELEKPCRSIRNAPNGKEQGR